MGRQPLPDAGGAVFVMPAQAGIEYSATSKISLSLAEYWIIRLRG